MTFDDEPIIQVDDETYEFKAIQAYLAGDIRFPDLQASLELSRAQTYRLVAQFKKDGPVGLQSKRLGVANHATPPERRSAVMDIVRESYADFGPKLASEKLAELHNIRVLSETLDG